MIDGLLIDGLLIDGLLIDGLLVGGYLLLVTCSVVSRTPCRHVVDTSGRGVARHLIFVWVVGASSCG
jgi:hypothetical protein